MITTSLILALREISRHLFRSFLTILGIVIGVFSVITMVTLGNGATSSIKASISALGSDILQIHPGQDVRFSGSTNDSPAFKLADIDAIREQIGGVNAATGVAQASGKGVRNAQNWSTSISGTTNDYFKVQKWEITDGRQFTKEEQQAGKTVCVIGNTIVKNLFQNIQAVGQVFRVKGVSCEVIGILATRGQSSFGNDQDDVVIMPMKAVQRQMTGNQEVGLILVGLDPNYDTTSVQKSLVSLLRERRGLAENADDNFDVLNPKQIADTISGTVNTLTKLIAAVAGISLLVGGIGIMNIMLVSVIERTREIGIRLAIGALGHEVLLQFLIESIALSCLGGLIGMILAFIVCVVAAPLMGVPFLFNFQVNLLGFVFSAFIGVVFGYFPARRAAALNPIDALRYD